MQRAAVAPGWMVLALAIAGCAGASDGNDDDGGAPAESSLVIEPVSATLEVVDGAAAEQPFRVFRVGDGGDRRDVTEEAAFSVGDPILGVVDEDTFVASGQAGGRTDVHAAVGDRRATAKVEVYLAWTSVDDPAPPDAPDRFDAAEPATEGGVTIEYPPDGVMLPPNLDEFEVHWRDDPGGSLVAIEIASEYLTATIYTAGETGQDGRWRALDPDAWTTLESSLRGETATLSLRSLRAGSPDTVVSADPIDLRLAEADIAGGIYYWASTTTDGSPAGIYRHDWGAELRPAEAFYTTDQSQEGRCVGCHALSGDGTKMAITFDGGAGPGAILDVATATLDTGITNDRRWTHTAWTPDGAYLVSGLNGRLVLRDGATGAELGPIDTGPGHATYPDFSPDGDALVYGTRDPHQVVVQPFDPTGATFGEPRVLSTGPVEDSYPAWAPDGRWILYNQDGPGGNELWAIPADDSLLPVKLAEADLDPSLHNAWPRWSPFVQQVGDEPVYWFTFSSDRDFGVRLAGEAGDERSQLWMAPFFPGRAEAGADPSEPAFRLPFQNLTGTNHIAQWTQAIIE